MIRVDVRVEIDNALRRLDVSADEARKAIPRALTKVANQAKTQAAREIRDVGYGIKVGRIKREISVRRATPTEFRAIVRASGRPIPLIEYGARQTKVGTTVAVLHGRRLVRGAFIATMKSGHKGVYIRADHALHAKHVTRKIERRGGRKTDRHGLPIDELFGPAVPSAFANEVVQAALVAAIRDKFPGVLKHELDFVLSRR